MFDIEKHLFYSDNPQDYDAFCNYLDANNLPKMPLKTYLQALGQAIFLRHLFPNMKWEDIIQKYQYSNYGLVEKQEQKIQINEFNTVVEYNITKFEPLPIPPPKTSCCGGGAVR